MRRLILSLLLLLLASAAGLRANDTEIQNVTMSPPNPATNTDVVICFQARNTGGGNIRFSVGYGPSGYVESCTTTNQINWLLDDAGVYRGGSLTVNGSPVAVTSNNQTDLVGPGNGINGGTSTTWETICFQTHIPPELSGNYELVVVPNRDGIGLIDQACGTCQQANNAASFGYLSFNVSGTAFVRLNLQVCNAGTCTTNAICFEYQVINYGESGVRLTGLDIKFCFYDPDTAWCAQASSNTSTYYANGTKMCNTYNPGDQFSFQWFSTVDCGTAGKTNGCYHYTLSGGPISQSMPYFVPPNGGYTQSESPALWFRHCDGSAHGTSSDFSNLASAASCGSGWSSVPSITLWNNGQLVCEYSSSSSTDQKSGVPHCGSTSGCNDCPTGAINNMAMNAWGNSNVVCVAVYSPTVTPTPSVTPAMALTKTASKNIATIGDVVTFCIAWKNDASASKAMLIWDSIPANISYIGADNGGLAAGTTVSWNLGTQASGASGQVCFWGTVSSYPYLPDLLERETADAPREDALEPFRGLWGPLHASPPKD